MAPSSPTLTDCSSDLSLSVPPGAPQRLAQSRWSGPWNRQLFESSRFTILNIFGLFQSRGPQATDIHLVTQTLPFSRPATTQRPPLLTITSPHDRSRDASPSQADTRRPSISLSMPDTEGGKAPSLLPEEQPDWIGVKDAIAGAGLGLELGRVELQAHGGHGLEDEHAADDEEAIEDGDAEDDAEAIRALLRNVKTGKRRRTSARSALKKVRQKSKPLETQPHPSQVSNNGSITDSLVRRETTNSMEVKEVDKPLKEGPSEAKFARDGFCSCSRFCKLTKADFELLEELETAVQTSNEVPFLKINDIRKLVQKVGQHPGYKVTAKYRLATSTPVMAWVTLALRRKEKNRSDNTDFYTVFREKMQKTLLELIKQWTTTYDEAYNNQDNEGKAKLSKLRKDIHQLSMKQKRSKHVDTGVSGTYPTTAPDLPFGPKDWPLSMDLKINADLFAFQSTISDNTEDPLLGASSPAEQASTSAVGAARSQKSTLTFDTVAPSAINVESWANDDSRPYTLPVPQPMNGASQKSNGATATEPTAEHVEHVITIGQPPSIAEPKSVFIVVGWFPSELHEPIEIYVRVDNLEYFLPDLKMHIMALRGWRSLFSFKSVQGFGLYKCHTSHFTHTTRHLLRDERVTLAHFFDATNSSYIRASPKPSPINKTRCFQPVRHWIRRIQKKQIYAEYRKREDSKQWACWVHETMNLGKECPFESQLSLKLLLNWSQGRIITAASVPLLLSFGIGLSFMLTHEGVDSIGTAWTIGSYIVTAGAFIITLLAVLSALKDGQTTTFTFKQSDTSPA